MKQSRPHWTKSGVKKNGVREGRKKQETDAEDKTGKKVMVCLIAKKLQWGRRGGRVGRHHNSSTGYVISQMLLVSPRDLQVLVLQALGYRRHSIYIHLTFKALPEEELLHFFTSILWQVSRLAPLLEALNKSTSSFALAIISRIYF